MNIHSWIFSKHCVLGYIGLYGLFALDTAWHLCKWNKSVIFSFVYFILDDFYQCSQDYIVSTNHQCLPKVCVTAQQCWELKHLKKLSIYWRLLFWGFLGLTLLVIFVNYFCLQNFIFLICRKSFLIDHDKIFYYHYIPYLFLLNFR